MFAIVESGSITSTLSGNKGVLIGDIKHSADIFTSKWTEAERNAIGVYTIIEDNANKKDEEWYVNTNQTYTFSGGKVTATYGSATARAIADTLWTSQDKTDGKIREGEDVGDVATKGLKTVKKTIIENQCNGLLSPSDWMAVKAFEEGGDVESGWKTWRASVRTKCNSMQTQIDNAADVDALAALYAYNTDNPPTRPLGQFPVKE